MMTKTLNINNDDEISTDGENLFFWGSVFSQFYPAKFKAYFAEDMILDFECAEQFMMANKAILFQDRESFAAIMSTGYNPARNKAQGRVIENFDEELWQTYRQGIVVEGNFLKFSQNQNLLDKFNEYKHLNFVEASPTDKIWGIGLHWLDPQILEKSNWNGENLLGVCLNYNKLFLDGGTNWHEIYQSDQEPVGFYTNYLKELDIKF